MGWVPPKTWLELTVAGRQGAEVTFCGCRAVASKDDCWYILKDVKTNHNYERIEFTFMSRNFENWGIWLANPFAPTPGYIEELEEERDELRDVLKYLWNGFATAASVSVKDVASDTMRLRVERVLKREDE